MPLLGAIETGGTKILARVDDEAGRVVAQARWATTSPDEAAAVLIEFLGRHEVAAIGLAAFGPLVVDPEALNYGEVLPTTKPHWTNSNIRMHVAETLRVPVVVDTDVNAAALAEQRLGAGRGCKTVAYVTVGTGIGGGLAIDGRSLRGAMHPEIGHLRLHRRDGDDQPSTCRFHPDCAEGLVAGPAVRARLGEGRALEDVPAQFDLVAGYLGQLFAQLVLAWSPERIVAGGGVLTTPGLIEAAREPMLDQLNGFGVGDAPPAPSYLVPAALTDAGLEGAMLMARDSLASGLTAT